MLIFKLVIAIYLIWNNSKVDTSSMKHFAQRDASLTKYYMIIFFFCLLDVYQIVMTFTVSLASLVRLKAIEERVEGYMKVTRPNGSYKGVQLCLTPDRCHSRG